MPERSKPSAVLFACSMNAVRSPMAEAIAKHLFDRSIYFQSAGARPMGELDPFAVKAMEEIGIDISKHKPKTFEDIEDSNFDLVISLAPEAHHKALEMTRTMAMDVEYWPTPDPQLASGSRDQIMDAYRQVRDGLIRRIKDRLGWTAKGHL
jgi:protein-tyrosine-phosphatase